MAFGPMHDDLPEANPLYTVRRLVDQALDDLGGLVATTESPQSDGMPRWLVRLVLLQALCGLRSDIDFARRLRDDGACRAFVGLAAENAAPSAVDCARARHRVLSVAGFGEFLGVLLDALARRGALAGTAFAPDRRLLCAASGAMLAPTP